MPVYTVLGWPAPSPIRHPPCPLACRAARPPPVQNKKTICFLLVDYKSKCQILKTVFRRVLSNKHREPSRGQ